MPDNPGTILISTHDLKVAGALRDPFREAGYRVLEAANGDDGMRMAVRVDYDLLLLDLVLPGLRAGPEATR